MQIILNEQIICLNDIFHKNIVNITFQETISLIFHAFISMINDESILDKDGWEKIYKKFNMDLAIQNQIKWPRLFFRSEYNHIRIDISTCQTFIQSANILTLLLRVLYIENAKIPLLTKYGGYTKILDHTLDNLVNIPIDNLANTPVKDLSLRNLFDLLRSHMEYYLKIYHNMKYPEYHLGDAILKKITP
jgi:hypothetical protein